MAQIRLDQSVARGERYGIVFHEERDLIVASADMNKSGA
jgi:hypothetical protein